MAEAIAFAAPRAEEMTKVVTGVVGAGITGAVEGIVVKMAPKMGALEPIFTWGTLLGVPTMAAALSLFTKGLLGDLFFGAACGGIGIVGYSLPEMLAPITGQRAPIPLGGGVKQLPAGPQFAPQRVQVRAAAALGSWASTPEEERGFVGQGHTVRDLA